MPDNEFDLKSEQALIYVICSVGCVTCAALAAGMTVGLLSLDSLKLKIKVEVGTEKERKAALKILPVIANHHLLLCTLLLFNALANEALPIFLDAIVPSWAAIVISVTLVLICGEVLPSALFTGPSQLQIASRFIGLIYFLEIIFYPIAYPMAKMLDRVLGHEDDDKFNRDEISALVKIMRQQGTVQIKEYLRDYNTTATNVTTTGTTNNTNRNQYNNNNINSSNNNDNNISNNNNSNNDYKNNQYHNPLTTNEFLSRQSTFPITNNGEDVLSAHEVNVITGVLGLSKILVKDVCIPMSSVAMLSTDQLLDQETIDIIDKVGFSRLPVFKGTDMTHILGYLLVKRLININPERALPVPSIPLLEPLVVGSKQSLLDVLKIFQSGHRHIALVSEKPKELMNSIHMGNKPSYAAAPIGILTVEDVFERMIQAPITDEEDRDKSMLYESASSSLRELSMRSSTSRFSSTLQDVESLLIPDTGYLSNMNHNNSNNNTTNIITTINNPTRSLSTALFGLNFTGKDPSMTEPLLPIHSSSADDADDPSNSMAYSFLKNKGMTPALVASFLKNNNSTSGSNQNTNSSSNMIFSSQYRPASTEES